MSYDSDDDPPRVPFIGPENPPPDPRDLEVIEQLLCLAAIELTPVRGATFTREELTRAACEYGIALRDEDIAIVLPLLPYLKRAPGGKWMMK